MTTKIWHRAEIIAAVKVRGTSLAALGRDNGLSSGTLGAALTYPRLPSNTIIAEFLGFKLHEIWPRWFDERGELITPVAAQPPYRSKANRSRSRQSSQKRVPKLNRNRRRAC